VKAKVIINATGPFSDTIRNLDDPNSRPLIAPSSGAHVILPNYLCPPDIGIVDAKTKDGRVLFILPFENHTLAGTTDHSSEISHHPKPTQEDIDFIMEHVGEYMNKEIKLEKASALSAWTGIRPLSLDPHSKNTSELSRNHVIHVGDSGLVSILGGKWTTYRKMAEETVDKAAEVGKLNFRRGATSLLLLWGAHGYNSLLSVQLIQKYGIDRDIAEHLSHNYGDKAHRVAEIAKNGNFARLVPGCPFLEAEVDYSVNEYAQTCVDVLARRTRLAFLDAEKSKQALPKVAEILGAHLHWDEEKKQKEIEDALKYLETMQ